MGRATVALLVVLVILAAGCVSANVERFDTAIRRPRPPETIAVLSEAPNQPYTVIAHIESRTDGVVTECDDLRHRLVQEAARLGGHGLILGPEITEEQPVLMAGGMIYADKTTLSADVIVFH